MKKILIIDSNYGFTADVESRLILEEIENVEIVTRNSLDHMVDDINSIQPNELLVAANMLQSYPDWNLGIPVKCYARDSEGIQIATEKGIPCYGVITRSDSLIRAIEKGTLVSVEPAKPEKNFHTPEVKREEPARPATTARQENLAKEAPRKIQESEPAQDSKESAVEEFLRENEEAIFEMLLKRRKEGNGQAQTEPKQHEAGQETVNLIPAENYESKQHTSQMYANGTLQESVPQQPQAQTMAGGDVRARLEQARAREAEEERKRQMAVRAEQAQQAEMMVEKDMGNMRAPARLITVYSAKGGVGKTTISSELATFLALTSHGRGKFKVCIADFNIDFGDVLNTLNFDPRKACMTLWAADIRERINDGAAPEHINYTEAEISTWLQHDEKNGLYALIAPITNEDSMDIRETELKVMLDNLVHNGGFDFVICDTGNNTRDSSFIPLENSDEILLVLTQSVNTANCNNGFLATMHKIGFDMDKIKIVINKVRPGKEVGISVEELEETFINPHTGQPYPCVGKIKDSNQVRNAGNLGEPLVYNSGHEFTKSIGEIASYLIGDNFVLSAPEKKKGLFGFFRRKKPKAHD